MSEYYKFCFLEIDGYHAPSVRLRNAGEIFSYILLQHHLFPEIRITDEDDYICFHVIDHKIVYPTKKEGMNLPSNDLYELERLGIREALAKI